MHADSEALMDLVYMNEGVLEGFIRGVETLLCICEAGETRWTPRSHV